MNLLQQDLLSLYSRDLDRLIENIKTIPKDKLWETPEGVTNSCGVLTQHIVGNLNHFIGNGIGNTGYIRHRDHEFTRTNISKEELIADIEELKDTLEGVFKAIDNEVLTEQYPLEIPYEATAQNFLVHLYGHLNYHLGQINYLRRILSPNG